MRAEAVSWDDWSVSNAPPILEEEKWHVALAPGEVKVVSLEQLDDLFRLSIVDAETKVWQNGMSEWQPLRVIAGIEDEPAAAPEPKRTYPKPPSPRSAPPPPRPASLAPRSAPPPPRPASLAPQPASLPPASFYPQPATAFAAPIVAPLVVPSVRPLVVSQAPRSVARGGGFGRFVLGAALVAGVVITLYRNEVLRSAAHSLHQDGLYARLEQALGGPAFGTLRAIEQQGAAAAALSVPVERPSPSLETTLLSATPPAATRNEPSAPNGAAAPPVVSLESLTPEKARPALAVPAALSMAAAPKNATIAKAAFEVKPKPAAIAKAAPLPVAEKPAKPESEMTAREKLNAAIGRSMLSAPPAPKKGAKAKGGSNEYDPLNPKL